MAIRPPLVVQIFLSQVDRSTDFSGQTAQENHDDATVNWTSTSNQGNRFRCWRLNHGPRRPPHAHRILARGTTTVRPGDGLRTARVRRRPPRSPRKRHATESMYSSTNQISRRMLTRGSRTIRRECGRKPPTYRPSSTNPMWSSLMNPHPGWIHALHGRSGDDYGTRQRGNDRLSLDAYPPCCRSGRRHGRNSLRRRVGR